MVLVIYKNIIEFCYSISARCKIRITSEKQNSPTICDAEMLRSYYSLTLLVSFAT